jgi:DNA polymerase III subunit epsilon
MIREGNWLVLDTETTGLQYPSEICQIAIVNPEGKTLVNELVKPHNPIPPDATRIHGIRDEDVKNARSWQSVFEDVRLALEDRDLVIYNADYDTMLMNWSCKLAGCDYLPTWKGAWCAMQWYAAIWKDFDEYYGTYRWQRLSNAAVQQKLAVKDAHNALGDCLMTLALIQKLVPKVTP